jgi:glucose-1-phosphate adenylyltransferase
VEAGAVVRNSIVLNDAHIAAGAQVDHAILDRRALVSANAQVGQARQQGDGEVKLAVVGQEAHIPANATVPADSRVAPNTTFEPNGNEHGAVK